MDKQSRVSTNQYKVFLSIDLTGLNLNTNLLVIGKLIYRFARSFLHSFNILVFFIYFFSFLRSSIFLFAALCFIVTVLVTCFIVLFRFITTRMNKYYYTTTNYSDNKLALKSYALSYKLAER